MSDYPIRGWPSSAVMLATRRCEGDLRAAEELMRVMIWLRGRDSVFSALGVKSDYPNRAWPSSAVMLATRRCEGDLRAAEELMRVMIWLRGRDSVFSALGVESIKIFEFEVFPRFFVIVLYAPARNLKAVTMSSSYLPATTESLDQAQEAKKPSEAISILYRILDNPSSSAEALRIKEKAISNLADLLREENRAEELRSLLTQLRPFFSLIPKAKTAKIVRSIIDAVAKIPNTSDLQLSLCKEMVQWTRTEKRTFLRQRVEARLASLLMESKEYSEALALLSSLIKEVRRLDDKLLLVDIELLESKLHFSLRNLPKAKASLTAARTAANAIYVPPDQQGTIDLQSGILHAEEKDYKTGYSYFYEAFEAFNALEDPRAIYSLKYMLLCKIMVSQADDVAGILSSAKVGLQYQGPEVDAMKAVAHAHAQRSLRLFETALRDFKAQLEEDPIVHRHLSSLYDTLLEQNLCRLIEPFSRVEIAHIAELIELPVDHVEKKLSQMILDKKFAGTLDQGAGCLIIFDDPKTDAIYPATLETISNIVLNNLCGILLALKPLEKFCRLIVEMFIGARIQKSSLNWGSQICFSSNDIECGFVQTEFAPFPAYLAVILGQGLPVLIDSRLHSITPSNQQSGHDLRIPLEPGRLDLLPGVLLKHVAPQHASRIGPDEEPGGQEDVSVEA
ncbi:hypothetical protein RHSIM_Rhsim02G0180600 [Rhododendron simsii]|uniref:PCI domain-containing protein n=1 Tax=Rhododendron simsii TaxID=118357 RepID=A0A834HIM9_RHOSS|nr:hypothetical protein RHSIM_Rhsim02G0180600 [Rhododendron simsii]